MYHDQGHGPMKLLAFDTGVNVTLGLPIIRTSVDHGTAFDIAWQGVAFTDSLQHALDYAWKLGRGERRRPVPPGARPARRAVARRRRRRDGSHARRLRRRRSSRAARWRSPSARGGSATSPTVVARIVAWVRAQGAVPFLVPAMGSHGGATAEGQRDVLAAYGFADGWEGCEVRSSMDVVAGRRRARPARADRDRRPRRRRRRRRSSSTGSSSTRTSTARTRAA